MTEDKGATSSIRIRQSDLIDDCHLLNRKLDLIDSQVAKLSGSKAGGSAAQQDNTGSAVLQATEIPAPGAIPKAGSSGKLAVGWIPDAARSPNTQTNQILSRAIGTTYQNTGGSVMWVAICLSINAGSSATASTGATSPPSVTVAEFSNPAASAAFYTFMFPVLPNYFYKVALPSGGLVTWVEWT